MVNAVQFPAALRIKLAGYALVLLSAGAFGYFRESFLPVLIVVAAAIISWLVVEGPRGRPVPKLMINLAVVGAAIYLWWEIQRSGDENGPNFAVALGHFIIALLICKLFERKTPRDLAQVAILSLVMVVVSTMFAATITYALIIVAYFLLLIYSIVLFSMQAQTAAAASGGMRVFPPAAGESGMFLHDIRRYALRAAMLLLPIAALIFLMIPRSGNARFNASPWSSGGATYQTGFGENVDFHDYGELVQSDDVAMEVKITQHGVNIGSEWNSPYFRGKTLDVYYADRHEWARSNSNQYISTDLHNAAADLVPQEFYAQSNLITQEYTVRIPAGNTMFVMVPPARIGSDQISSVKYNYDNQAMAYSGPRVPLLKYSIQSFPENNETALAAVDAIGATPSQPPQTGEFLPAKDWQILTGLARTILDDQMPAPNQDLSTEQVRAISDRFENYLRTHYPYSLKFGQVDHSLDPYVDFLVNRKETGGHCECFASCMVMLCRCVGINARMVTGYHGAEFNSIGGYYIVRQKDAHAWTEVEVPGGGWQEYDPSPAASTLDDSESFMKRWAREMVQFAQSTWLMSVVTFDNESRNSVRAWFSHLLDGPRSSLADIFQAMSVTFRDPSDAWLRASLFGPMLGLIVITGWTYRKWKRDRVARTVRKNVRLDGSSVFLDELFKLVARASPLAMAARTPDQTPREFIELHAGALGEAAQDARWLVETFYALHFGAIRSTRELRTQIAASMKHVKEVLRRRVAGAQTH